MTNGRPGSGSGASIVRGPEVGAHAPHFPLALVLDAGADFALAALCAAIWLGGADAGTVRCVTASAALEFLVIQSAVLTARAMFAQRGARALTITLVAGFDAVLLVGVAVLFANAWPLLAFWMQAAVRVGGTLWEGRRTDRDTVVEPWAAAMFAWAGCAVLTHAVPLPRLGIGELPSEAAWMAELDLWHGEPHRAVAFALLYCLAMGVSKLVRHRWVRVFRGDEGWLD